MSRVLSFSNIPKARNRAWPSDLLQKFRTSTSTCCNTDDGIPPSGVRNPSQFTASLDPSTAGITSIGRQRPRNFGHFIMAVLHLRISIRCNLRAIITLFLPRPTANSNSHSAVGTPKTRGFHPCFNLQLLYSNVYLHILPHSGRLYSVTDPRNPELSHACVSSNPAELIY